LRLLARPEGAHEHEASDAGLLRRGEKVARALGHHSLELLLLALADRDQVHDRIHALDSASQAGRIGHVPLDELDIELRRTADEAANRSPGGPERSEDVTADEAGPAREQDHVAVSRSKFCQ